MHPQDIAAGTIQPGQDDDLAACSDTVEGVKNRRLEDEPRVWRALVALLGAAAGSLSGDSTVPIGVSSKRGWFTSIPPFSACSGTGTW